MQIGIAGLGRMGMNMARRLIEGGHDVVVYNRTYAKVEQLMREGAAGAANLDEMVDQLALPRIVWLMLPAGEATELHVDILLKRLREGDILIDGGNGYYKDDIRRAEVLKEKGIRYMDAGVSGGIWGLKEGYCTMVGGEKEIFDHIEPLLQTLAPKEGYLHCGPVGAGHFVKMVHNGIEYAMMEAYGEGFGMLKSSPYSQGFDFEKIAHLWNRGSVIRSWLLELLEDAFKKSPKLDDVMGYVEDSGEGRWAVKYAVESATPATAIAQALFKRFESREPDLFSDKVLAALRNEFGGHDVVKK